MNMSVSSYAYVTYEGLAFYFVLQIDFISLVLKDTERLLITADHIRLCFCTARSSYSTFHLG